MYDKKILQRLLAALNSTYGRIFMGFGAAVGVMDWSVGGTPLSAALLALRVDLKSMAALLAILTVLGITAKSRNTITSGRSYGDAVNITRWLCSTIVATVATMVGLAPVALLCYVCTGSASALLSTSGTLYVGGIMLMAWIVITAVQDLASEKYDLYRRQRPSA